LRSAGDDLSYKQAMAELRGLPAISDADGEREILNRLLPQILIDDRIKDDEHPRDGIIRLIQKVEQRTSTDGLTVAMNAKDRTNLEACLKWLTRAKLVEVETTATSVSTNRT
jgi:hypothetical protein